MSRLSRSVGLSGRAALHRTLRVGCKDTNKNPNRQAIRRKIIIIVQTIFCWRPNPILDYYRKGIYGHWILMADALLLHALVQKGFVQDHNTSLQSRDQGGRFFQSLRFLKATKVERSMITFLTRNLVANEIICTFCRWIAFDNQATVARQARKQSGTGDRRNSDIPMLLFLFSEKFHQKWLKHTSIF